MTKPKPAGPIDPAYTYRATVLEVTGPNGLFLQIDLGFRVNCLATVLLDGVIPPTSAAEERAAHDYLQTVLALRSRVIVTTSLHEEQPYQLWWARIYYGRTSINELMISQGHGRAPSPY